MANGLSLTGAGESAGVFDCPGCKKTINIADAVCPYCGVTIDRETAEREVARMEKINRACSDAVFLRTAILLWPVSWLLMLVPIIGWVGLGGSILLFFVLVFLIIRWWVRNYNLRSTEADFKRARTTVLVITALVAVFALLRAL
jgi:predicted RNA-binding Zn-ribbon protein involved in translation (DUF1610 family)